jgi:hypothetical protein
VIQASVGLNLLARAASEPHLLPPVAAASIEPTIPNDNQNKCSHRNCFIPFKPSTCCTMGCDGKVHQYCCLHPRRHFWIDTTKLNGGRRLIPVQQIPMTKHPAMTNPTWMTMMMIPTLAWYLVKMSPVWSLRMTS